MKGFRNISMYSFASSVHKKMYGTVTKLAILEVTYIIGEYLCEQLKEDKVVHLDNFIKIKISKVISFGKIKNTLVVKTNSKYSSLLFKTPLIISDEELAVVNEKRRKRIEKYRTMVKFFADRTKERRAQWISERTKRKSLAHPIDS